MGAKERSSEASERRRPDGEDRCRHPYRPPRLERHGRLAETTRFGGSEILDSGSGLGQAP